MTRRGLVAAVAAVAVLAAIPAAASAADTPATPDPAVTCPYGDGIPDRDRIQLRDLDGDGVPDRDRTQLRDHACLDGDGVPDQERTQLREHARIHAENMVNGTTGSGHMAREAGAGFGPGPRS